MGPVSKWQIVRDIMQEDADSNQALKDALLGILDSAGYRSGEALEGLHQFSVSRSALDHARDVLNLD